MKLTKKQAYKLHYELWDWVYHHPSKKKEDWPEWEYNGGKITATESDCFLCEIYDCLLGCPLCINGRGCNDPYGGMFFKWEHAKTLKTKKKYAKLIRDIILYTLIK